METSVLVIEDEKDHRPIILTRLTQAGYSNVQAVGSLKEGVQAGADRPRDVLVIDSGVVGGTRAEAVWRCRDASPPARLVGYSPGAQKEKWADAHVAKGAPFDELLAAIQKERDDLQNPLTHEGADPDPTDSNENADDKAEVLQPDGSEVPRPEDD